MTASTVPLLRLSHSFQVPRTSCERSPSATAATIGAATPNEAMSTYMAMTTTCCPAPNPAVAMEFGAATATAMFWD